MRDYRLEIDLSSGSTAIIKPPLELSFSCDKSADGGLQNLVIKVKNLNSKIRNQLVRDVADSGKLIKIRFFAGYINNIKLLTSCTLHEGRNDRKGAEIETSLTCIDGGFDQQNSVTNATVTTKSQAYDTYVSSFSVVKKGYITKQQEILRPKVLVGNTIQLIKKGLAPDEDFFIDNEQIFIMKKNEVRRGAAPLISASTGLLNTPQKSNNLVIFSMLVDPTIKLNGLVEIKSKFNKAIDGTYKVVSINYNGDFEGQSWQQEITAAGVGNTQTI